MLLLVAPGSMGRSRQGPAHGTNFDSGAWRDGVLVQSLEEKLIGGLETSMESAKQTRRTADHKTYSRNDSAPWMGLRSKSEVTSNQFDHRTNPDVLFDMPTTENTGKNIESIDE